MASICVVGGGPAGSVFAARMALFGHTVTLVEREAFPRPRLGESLSPGVLPLLGMIGARQRILDARFPRIAAISSAWDDEPTERHDPQQAGMLVDRGRFDALLLGRARELGVTVHHPASVRAPRRVDGRWCVVVDGERRSTLHVDFIADAGGRHGVLPGRRTRPPVSTIALYCYWRGADLPRQPRIEAGADAWYWGVPLPDGSYNTLVFLDPATVRARRPATLESMFREQLRLSGLLAGSRDAAPASPVRAIDATPYLEAECVTESSLKVGDAAVAIDPISSSGVQKAIQTALAASVVANTILQRPEHTAAASAFYRGTLAGTAERHRRWAAAQYARVAARHPARRFWAARAADAMADHIAPVRLDDVAEAVRGPDTPGFVHLSIAPSPLLEFVDVPCIDGEFVTLKRAIRHPAFDEPVAFVGRWELAALLARLRPPMTPLDVARAWSDCVPLPSGLAVIKWLLDREVLVPAATAHGGSLR